MKRSNVAVAAVAVVVPSFLPSSGAPLALPAGRAASASVFHYFCCCTAYQMEKAVEMSRTRA